MSCAPLFFCAFTGLEYSFFQLFLCSIRRRGSSEILIKIRDTSLWKFVPFSRQAECEKFRLCHDTGSACYGCFRHSRRVCRYFNVGEKRWWVFFLNDKNRIQYNDQCKKCVYECKQSFRCRIVWCGKYYSKRRKR